MPTHEREQRTAAAQGTAAPATSIPDGWPSPPLADTIAASRQFLEGRRVLVTGGFSFLGGHLARALQAAGATVACFDDDTSKERGSHLNLTGLRDQVELVAVAMADVEAVSAILASGAFDYFFDLATGCDSVVDAVRRLPVTRRPMVVLTTSDKLEPEATATVDKAVMACYGDHGVPLAMLRLCNLFGPYDFDQSHLIPRALRNMLRDGEAPDLYFNAVEHYRDYLFVEDAVRALLLMTNRPACRGQIYDLPGARYAATPDVLHELIEVAGLLQAEDLEHDPQSSFARLHWNRTIRIGPSDPSPTLAHKPGNDGSSLHDDTGFTPAVGFRDGLARSIRYYAWYFTEIAPAASRIEAPTGDGIGVHLALPVTTLGPSPAVAEATASPPMAPAPRPLYHTLYPRARTEDGGTDDETA